MPKHCIQFSFNVHKSERELHYERTWQKLNLIFYWVNKRGLWHAIIKPNDKLICAIELFVLTVFTERPQLQLEERAVPILRRPSVSLSSAASKDAIQLLLETCCLCCHWGAVVNCSCVYRKVWSRFERRLPMWRRWRPAVTIHHTCSPLLVQPTKVQLDKNPNNSWARWMQRLWRLRTPCLGSPPANQRMNRSTSLFTRREVLQAGSTLRWVILIPLNMTGMPLVSKTCIGS